MIISQGFCIEIDSDSRQFADKRHVGGYFYFHRELDYSNPSARFLFIVVH